jgi:hypothetical protein
VITDIMSISKIETDVILNKANVALARSQRLVASWLPPKTAEEQDTKSEEEIQREEDEIFTAMPETYAFILLTLSVHLSFLLFSLSFFSVWYLRIVCE